MNPNSAIARHWDFSLPIASLAINRKGDWIALAMGDGSLRLLPANEEAKEAKELKLHNGVSLSLAADADEHAFLSGGDDGKVFIIDPALDTPTQLVEHKNKWIDHVASDGKEGLRAYSVGKAVHILNDEGEAVGEPRQAPSSPGGLAFSPNGKRLAATHYNGISLWWTNSKETAPAKLMWKGSHLGVLWHPEGKIVMTSMQESALHGWRLSDNAEMQMQGYAGKIHGMAFTPRARYLATSGADQVICWPFFGGGPWNKAPLTLGGLDGRLVTRVAPHPKDEIVAAGYDDGMIILAPLDGRMEMLIHPPVAKTGAAVVGMSWNGAGDCLFVALENGYVAMFTLKSVQKSVTHV
jgi:WD40 repeat protein